MKYTLVDTPQAAPGDCLLCKSPDGPFVDTSLYIEFHGAVYICRVCMMEMGNLFNVTPPEIAEKLKAQVELLERDVYRLTRKEASLEEAINGLSVARNLDGVVASELGVGGIAASANYERPRSEGEPVGAGEGETPEPSDDEGMGELRSDDASYEYEPTAFNL